MDVSPLQFTEWGYSISRDFIKDHADMNNSIVKIANDNNLTPTQIQRICEISNHKVYSDMFKQAEDKTFSFDLADCNKIIELMENNSQDKIASDYLLSPKQSKKYNVNEKEIFGVHSIGNEPYINEAIKLSHNEIEKINAAKYEISTRLVATQEMIKEAEVGFYNTAKQMVLNGEPMEDISSACRSVYNDSKMTKLLIKTASKLAFDGAFGPKVEMMFKKAEKVDTEYISEQLVNDPDIRVINGNHPIVSYVNTLADNYKKLGELENSLTLLDDKINLINLDIKNLDSSKNMDTYIQTEL